MTHRVVRIGTIAWCCLLVAAGALAQDGADRRQRLKTVERQLAELRTQQEGRSYLTTVYSGIDVRGRRPEDDFEQFVYAEALQQRMNALLTSARGEEPAEAATALEEAENLMSHTSERAQAIERYWRQQPAIFWRERWKQFAEANGVPVAPPDPELENVERTMLEQLGVGDFARAADESAPRLGARLRESIGKATKEIVNTRDNADLKFVPRSGACKSGNAGRTGDSAARVTRSPPPEDYYPPAAKRRAAQGDIVVRALVEATGCPTDFAVVVSSGHPELDAAAIKIAEGSRYAPATDRGKPIEGQATFKVRFVLMEE